MPSSTLELNPLQPKILADNEGIVIESPIDKAWIKLSSAETNGGFIVVEAQVPYGHGPGLHRHSREDETFIVREGEVEFTINGEVTVAGPGAVVFAPRGSAHTFRGASMPHARFYVMVTGSNFEAFYPRYMEAMMAGDPERANAIAAEHGIEMLG